MYTDLTAALLRRATYTTARMGRLTPNCLTFSLLEQLSLFLIFILSSHIMNHIGKLVRNCVVGSDTTTTQSYITQRRMCATRIYVGLRIVLFLLSDLWFNRNPPITSLSIFCIAFVTCFVLFVCLYDGKNCQKLCCIQQHKGILQSHHSVENVQRESYWQSY